MSINIQHQLLSTADAEYLTAIIEGEPHLAASGQPNFPDIVRICTEAFLNEGVYEGPETVDEVVALFDLEAAVAAKFEKLSDRISVRDGEVYLDGDAVDSTLAQQIASFLDEGVEDWQPLVAFYEKLLTNPLGNVQQGVYDWIKGESGEGIVTIAPDGDLLGYKSVARRETPEWRDVDGPVFVPSQVSRNGDVVNGEVVPSGKYIEQVPGDVVEMPRSKTPNTPSQECGVGLHIGTWEYASTFYGGDTVMLVKFNPRDIVSLPDSNSTWKLRVCRYTVIDEVTEPLDTPLYLTESKLDDADEAEGYEGGILGSIDLVFLSERL